MKIHATLSFDEPILKAHKALGSNVSKLCNDYLTAYLIQPNLIEQTEANAKAIINTIQEVQKQAISNEKTNDLLKQARILKAQGKDFKHLIDQAQTESGLTRPEVVQKMERNGFN